MASAALIQKVYRGYVNRVTFEKEKGRARDREEQWAATMVQSVYRAHVDAIVMQRELSRNNRYNDNDAAVAIQRAARGFAARSPGVGGEVVIPFGDNDAVAKGNAPQLASTPPPYAAVIAACSIQWFYRGHVARIVSRREMARHRDREEADQTFDAAISIQSAYRGFATRQRAPKAAKRSHAHHKKRTGDSAGSTALTPDASPAKKRTFAASPPPPPPPPELTHTPLPPTTKRPAQTLPPQSVPPQQRTRRPPLLRPSPARPSSSPPHQPHQPRRPRPARRVG